MQDYRCVLCPVSSRHYDLLEPLKQSKHKKTEREREKDRGERELASQFLKDYAKAQRDRGWPEMPREALKKTANNNWVHVTCAVWTQEVKFSKASALEVAEGIARGPIPAQRLDLVCKFCKTMQGLCISCPTCHDNFHVGCAHLAGCIFGFDVTPVKSSRRDHVSVVTLGQETGYMTAAVWCKEHQVKTIVHAPTEMAEVDDDDDDDRINTLQLFARTYKQADLTYAGTVRKANLVSQFTKAAAAAAVINTATSSPSTSTYPPSLSFTATNNRRTSAAPSTHSGAKGRRSSISGEDSGHDRKRASSPSALLERRCYRCQIDVSPKWWKVGDLARVERMKNGVGETPARGAQINGTAALPFEIDSISSMSPARPRDEFDSHRNSDSAQIWQCHKCHWKAKHDPGVADEPVRQGIAGNRQQQVNVSGWPAYQRPALVNGVTAMGPGENVRSREGTSFVGGAHVDSKGFPMPKPRPTPPPQLPMHHSPLGPSFYPQNHRNGYQHHHQHYQHSSHTRPPASGGGPPSLPPPPQAWHSPSVGDERPPLQSPLGRPVYASRQPPPSPLLPTSASSLSSPSTSKQARHRQIPSSVPSLPPATTIRDDRPGTGSSSSQFDAKANAVANGLRSPIEASSRGFGTHGRKQHPQPSVQSSAQSGPQTSPTFQQPQHMAVVRSGLPPPQTSPEAAAFWARKSLPSTPKEVQQQQHDHQHNQPSSSSQEAPRPMHSDEHRYSQGMDRNFSGGNGNGIGSGSGSSNDNNNNYDHSHGHGRKASSVSIVGAATPAAHTHTHPSTPRESGPVAGLTRTAQPPTPTSTSAAPTLTPAPESAAIMTTSGGLSASTVAGVLPGKADGRPGSGSGSGVGGASASPSLKNLLH